MARLVTEAVDVPTIGIGAGADCDGQVLVYHDLLGMDDRTPPKFVRRYAHQGASATDAVRALRPMSGRVPSRDKRRPTTSPRSKAEALSLYGS
ncbi:MAG: 3-methyl-2-oxobutanoate hydroxymethyltransferase [Microthrixaceae bacterium]